MVGGFCRAHWRHTVSNRGVKSANRSLLTFGAVLLTVRVTALVQTADTLDLTKIKPGTASSTGGLPVTVPATGLSAHSVREKAPLTVSITSLDQVSYAYGQPFTIHLVLRNTGTQSFVLPWEPDPERASTGPGAAPQMSALLSVAVTLGEGQPVTLPVAVLYGSNTNPMSVKVLQPGASADIIADARWAFPWYAEGKMGPPGKRAYQLAVAARLAFLTGIGGHVYGDVDSVNKVQIEVRKSQQ